MFSRKKIAAVSGLLGSLVVTCAGIGATQAFAAAAPVCSHTAESTTCVQRIVGSTPEGDGYVLRQAQGCTPTEPLSLPVVGLLNRGNMQIGPQVTCSPTTPGPERGEEGMSPLGLMS
uniref:Secreted protein n=1 Tax=Streptomyces sp. NBC_00003 TaxID=2903608 RepID=A0AAU2V994_9ACTN